VDGEPRTRAGDLGKRLEGEESRGQDQGEAERKGDDVEPSGAPGREELAVPAKQIEQRLGDGKGGEDGEMSAR
jgi:hypothetical protein